MELRERSILTCTHSLPTLNPRLEIPIEAFKAVLGLLPHSNHIRNHTFTNHKSQQPVELLFLNERCCALCDLALSEVEGMVAVEGTKQASTSPAEGCWRVFLTLSERGMFEGEVYLGVYDNRRIHGAYFNHNV